MAIGFFPPNIIKLFIGSRLIPFNRNCISEFEIQACAHIQTSYCEFQTGIINLSPLRYGEEIRFGHSNDNINLEQLMNMMGSKGQNRVLM